MLYYSEDNTDDEQEDLPYDGDLQNIYQLYCDSENVEDLTSVENASPSFFTLASHEINNHSTEKSDCKSQVTQRKISLASLPRENDMDFTMATEKELPAGDFSCSRRNQHFSSSKMSDVLLRHFPKEEFCPLIDSETIPEISLTESVDETILNKIKKSDSTATSLTKEEKINLECYSSEREGKCESAEKAWDLIGEQFAIDEKTNSSYYRKDCKADNQQFLTQKEDTINEELNYFSNPKEEYEEQKDFLEMTGCSQNLKYGQRQVHYRLPDFSKVAPKVKIPKGTNNKPAPIMKKTKSSPNLLGISAIVKDVLEGMNYLESVAVKNPEHETRIPELDQQLELLTKQAEAQNHIDHLRFNTKLLPHSNSHSPNTVIKRQDSGVTSEGSTVLPVTVPVRPMLGFPPSSLSEAGSQRMVSPLPSAGTTKQSFVSPPLQKATEGGKLSQMLKKQTEELKTKVEKFSKCMAQDVVPVQECHQFFMLLKEQLALLERNYLAMREKHGVLQLQNYKHSSTNTGEFDPDRKVEGEIFKLEMLLEDIKEKVDKRHSLHSSAVVTSPSHTPCESVCSSFSSRCEINHYVLSPVISCINEPPSKTTTGMNVSENEKDGEERNNPIEVTGVANNKSEKTRVLQSRSQFKLIQSDCSDQEDTDGNLSYWEMRSPLPANHTSNIADLTVLKEQGGFAYLSDHCFPEALENPAKENIIHPRLKIQLSSKQICSCSSSRNKNIEYRKTNSGKSDCERFSIFLEGKAVDLDSSGSDTEDSSFCNFMGNSSSKSFLEQRTKSNQSSRVNLKEQSKAFSQKKSIAFQRIYATNQPEQVTDRHYDRYSRMYDTIILSPQYLTSRNTHGKKSMSNLRSKHIKDTDTKVLNSTLDHVIQTANSLKKTTEHMIQIVSEDLAKAKTQITNTAATQYYN